MTRKEQEDKVLRRKFLELPRMMCGKEHVGLDDAIRNARKRPLDENNIDDLPPTETA